MNVTGQYWYGDLQLYFCLTELCNWKCSYCDFPLLEEKKHVDLDYLNEILKMVRKVSSRINIEFSVEGGELGLLPEKTLDSFFNSGLARTYFVATNGLFYKKGYYKKYKDKIHTILYHVKPEFSENDYDFNYLKTNCITWHTVVISKENLNYLGSLLDYHPNIVWFPHVLQPRIPDLDIMDITYYNKIYETVKNRNNVHQFFINRYKKINEIFWDGNYMKMLRELCCNNYTKAILNLPDKKIHRCCISMNTSSVDLTEKNIIKLLSNDPLFPIWDPVCEDCIANFIFRDYLLKSNESIQIIRKMMKRKRMELKKE